MTIWSMRIAFWIPKATNTHSEYVICLPTATIITRKRLNVTFVRTYIYIYKVSIKTQPFII